MPQRIVDWQRHYESAASRAIRDKRFCLLPNKQHGMGYVLLLSQENGEAMYGAFCALVLLLSRQAPPRLGWLTHDGTATGEPMRVRDIAAVTRFSEATIGAMLEHVSDPRIGWLVDDCGELLVCDGEVDAKPRRRGGDEDGAASAEVPPVLAALPSFAEEWAAFAEHRRQLRVPLSPIAARKALNLLAQYPDDAVGMLRASVINGWRGIFPPKHGSKTTKEKAHERRNNEAAREFHRADDCTIPLR